MKNQDKLKPQAKRELSHLTALEIVAVDPIALPNSQVFYLDILYLPDRVRYFDRDEFNAYDDELRIYVKELYPEYFI